MHEPIVAHHWLTHAAPKAAPALATSTVLALARIWNANGAEHSVGNAVLMGALALGAAAAGASAINGRHGSPELAATGFGASAALALAGVAGYADGLALPLLLWAIATILAYILLARLWRTDRRERVAFERHMGERHAEHAHVERVEALRADAQTEVARSGAAYAEQLAAALITRATLPGYDPKALHTAGLPQLPTREKEI
ncbi:hypothetical protein U9R90_35610 [Streptomyces sp. E11-3]|uniref:hypothetical protein n=1 Tax=Streptomyces sp. E11-3 TaxID=3110112 RepID=UPI00398093F0